MKPWKSSILTLIAVCAILLFGFSFRRIENEKKKYKPFVPPKGCVFRTIMGEESAEHHFPYKTPEKVQLSMDRALGWIVNAQNQNGGWGAGSHSRQDITDPHAVAVDPATTAMVSMALLRSGTSLTDGKYSVQLKKALYFLLKVAETSNAESNNIT